MAFYNGRDGVVKAGDPATVVGEVQSWGLDVQNPLGEAWGMGDTAARYFPSVSKASGNLEVYMDPDDAGQAQLAPGATVKLELYPGGEATGAAYFSFSAIIESLNRAAAKDGVPTVSVAFKVTGPITADTVS